ncbi:MAG: hypothetical protein HYV97_10450 [Bdellovibrio sp.]|nr:hypothetical protein [Bdellovibrio sp.]
MIKAHLFLVFIFTLASRNVFSQTEHHQEKSLPSSKNSKEHSIFPHHQMKKHFYPMTASDCSEKEVYLPTMAMCMPFPMGESPMGLVMLSGNAFVVASSSEGPRGRRAITSPNMFMLDAGRTLGTRHYVNFNLMGTFERWTFPENGYPEILQIGENDVHGKPYLDGQHPHSSPIMGMTLSDMIRLENEKDYLRVFFAPRGESTDGPIAFMHRPTGIINPDVPLGHHIGQDVGHISSTVLGGSLAVNKTNLQLSIFNGSEPEPTKVDLPLGSLNSWAARLIQEFSPRILGMISIAYVKEPEGHHDESDAENNPLHQWRFSTSAYTEHAMGSDWTLYNALIYGHITNYERASTLSSLTQEFWLKSSRPRIWSRIEFVQRTARQLQISSVPDQDTAKWVSAVTLGYSYALVHFSVAELAIGTSVTKDFLPAEFISAYAGNPWTGKILLQIRGMGMQALMFD